MADEAPQPRDVPVKVGRVRVEGTKITKAGLVVPEVKDILSSSTQNELFQNIMIAHTRLHSYDIFEKVSSELDTMDDADALDVLLKVKEKNRYHMKMGMEAGANEVLTNMSGQLINLFGGAESLKVQACVGHTRSTSYEVTLLKPLSYRVAVSNMYASAYRHTNNQLNSLHTEDTVGSTVGVKIPTPIGQYSCGYVFDCRHITGLSPTTPLSVRLEGGHTVKSSVQHSFEMNRTNSAAFPSRGVRCRLSQEVAGLGGDVRYLKTDGELQLNAKVPKTPLVVSTSLQAGAIATDVTDVPICDRFFLGGPQSIRGYRLRGVGPRDGGASLGGRAFAAGGVHLFSPLPYVPSDRVRLHLFATGGSLLPDVPSPSAPLNRTTRLLQKHFAWSYGVGLAVNVGVGRIEFNYCFPKPGEAQCNPLQGLHVGLGVSFL